MRNPRTDPRFALPQPGTPPWRILMVVIDPKRQDLLQKCVQANLPGARVDVVDSYFEAMERSTRMQTHLLVLDLSMDSVLMPALKRFMARSVPDLLVHAFDDSLDGPSNAPTDCNRPSIVRLKQAFADLLASRSPHQ